MLLSQLKNVIMLKMKSTAYALVLFCVSLLFCNFTSRADVNSYVPDTQVQYDSLIPGEQILHCLTENFIYLSWKGTYT